MLQHMGGHHQIERPVLKGKVLYVTLTKVGDDPAIPEVTIRLVHYARRDVDAVERELSGLRS